MTPSRYIYAPVWPAWVSLGVLAVVMNGCVSVPKIEPPRGLLTRLFSNGHSPDYTLAALNIVGGLGILAIVAGLIMRALGFAINGKLLSHAALCVAGAWVLRTMMVEYQKVFGWLAAVGLLLFVAAWVYGHRKRLRELAGLATPDNPHGVAAS